jgi:hypothetical protein
MKFLLEENLDFRVGIKDKMIKETSRADIHLKLFQAARNRMVDYKIPQDAQWGDIDIMERSLDFTGEKAEVE